MSALTDSRRMLGLLAVSAILCAVVVLLVILAGLTDDGSLAWTNRDFSNYWIASRLVLEGPRNGFDLTQLISHRFSLEDAVAAIELASHPQPDSMKIVIQPGA